MKEFSEILKEKNQNIINLLEKLTNAENERDLLKLASQKPDENIFKKSITNERFKQKNNQSSGNANSELSTRRADDLNQVNNSTLQIPSLVTSPKVALSRPAQINQIDNTTNEPSIPRNCNEPSDTLISESPKNKVYYVYPKTDGGENVQPHVK